MCKGFCRYAFWDLDLYQYDWFYNFGSFKLELNCRTKRCQHQHCCVMLRLVCDQYKESFYPYLERGPTVENDTMWFIGRGGRGIPFFKFFACSLFCNLGRDNCVIVPEAPVEVLQQLGELIHTG